MQTEFEAKFTGVDIIALRARLSSLGAQLLQSETLYKRAVFNPPPALAKKGFYGRVRDEGNRVTMSLKSTGKVSTIDQQKEIELIVTSFESAVDMLVTLGFEQKAYQETKREKWQLAGAEICIDSWPFLESFVEIEGSSEQQVKYIASQLGFDYSSAIFGAVDVLYAAKYGIDTKQINMGTPRIVFGMQNPFLKD